jgi:hypothetical protein
MDNLVREGEQALESQMGGSDQGNMGGGNNNDQGGGNMGGGNEGGGNMGGGNMNQQSGGGQSSGGGFLGGLQKTGENAMVDQGMLASILYLKCLANVALRRGQSIRNQGGCASGNGRRNRPIYQQRGLEA